MRRLLLLALALAALLGGSTTRVAADGTPAFVVIVNPDNPNGSMKRQILADAFFKKVTTWPGGVSIRPVDLSPKSGVRARFSEDVLHRSVSEVKSYWQQRIFSGEDVPPPELESDDDVVQYVLKHAGAVGYVSGATKLSGAKVLRVE